MKKILGFTSALVSAFPALALAQSDNLSDGYLSNLLANASGFLGDVVIFLIAFGVAWFVWNVIKFTMATDEDKKGEAKSQMIWGIISLAVIISIWGLVGILQSTFGLEDSGADPEILRDIIPTVNN